jgi:hypothetical protein
MFVIFSDLNYSQGTLTIGWTVWIAFLCAIGGAFGAVLGWYMVTLPLIKSRNE